MTHHVFFARSRAPLRLLALTAVLLLAAGCAAKGPPRLPVAPELAATAWQTFEHNEADRAARSGPFRLQCSLRYTDENSSGQRGTLVIWGNDAQTIRLDVTATLNTLVARVRQQGTQLVIHSPREEKAWVYNGSQKAVLSFGMPLPLAIPDIVAIIQGRLLDVLGPVRGLDPFAGEDGDIVYRLEGGALTGTLTLTRDGLPVHWQEGPNGWSVRIAYEGTPPLPQEIAIERSGGWRGVIKVINRQQPAPFGPEQLRLDLPQGTMIETMRQAAR